MNPERSVLADAQLCDETLFHSYYREWSRRMAGALTARGETMDGRMLRRGESLSFRAFLHVMVVGGLA